MCRHTPRRTPSLICATLALVGCVVGESEPADPGLTRFYVIAGVDVVSDRNGPVGVDLDGVTSTGVGPSCVDRTSDYPSSTEPGVDGVDNAFADGLVALVDPDGDGPCNTSPDWDCEGVKLTQRFALGEGLVVLEVSGIDEVLALDAVRVLVHRASAVGAPLLADGMLAPDQQFALTLLTETSDATISGGRLRARFHAPLALNFPLLTPPLHDAQLSVEISPTELRGALGGALDPDEAAVLYEAARAGAGDAARAAVLAVADLDPDPGDATKCRAASLGLGIQAVSAMGR